MNQIRNYSCKDEELIVICNYLTISFRRDMADFTAYSPKFNAQYLSEFQQKINDTNNIVFSDDATKELKIVTARLYGTMDRLSDSLNFLRGYISMAKGVIPFSAADFGITVLKRKIKSRDAEGVLKNLQMLNGNIEKYSAQLAEQGLTPQMIQKFKDYLAEIENDNQKQYEIISNRRISVENNTNMFNDIYRQLMEICEIGKIIYKKTQSAKLQDYTFTDLVKRVRVELKKTTV